MPISIDERAAAHRAGHSTSELRRMRRQQQETANALPQPVIDDVLPGAIPLAIGTFLLTAPASVVQTSGTGFTQVIFTDGFSHASFEFVNDDFRIGRQTTVEVTCSDPEMVTGMTVSGNEVLIGKNTVYLTLAHSFTGETLTLELTGT
jgi:hypothetical protein